MTRPIIHSIRPAIRLVRPRFPSRWNACTAGSSTRAILIEWRIESDADGNLHGFWCYPTPGCGGVGFGFDILPTDPDYRDERGGWMHCDDEYDEDDFAEDDLGEGFSSDGPIDKAKPSGNGNGRPKIEDDRGDDIPY